MALKTKQLLNIDDVIGNPSVSATIPTTQLKKLKILDSVYSIPTYVLPLATSSTLGGVKIGYTTSGKNYKLQLDSSGNAFVNVPWTDTVYTLPTASSVTLGGVKPVTKTDEMTQPVGVDSDGALWAKEGITESEVQTIVNNKITYTVNTDGTIDVTIS